jgi:hypothetical protein
MDWAPVNSALLTIVVLLLTWIKVDVGRVTHRVDNHLDGHP